jgi:hypothetical protein
VRVRHYTLKRNSTALLFNAYASASRWRPRSLTRTGGLLIDACLTTPPPGDQANAQLAGSTVLWDCDERLRLTSIQIPTINAASIPMTGDTSTATSSPTAIEIATVTISHQEPKPRSLPIVAMNRDLIWARTQPTALESLPRSQRNGMNNRARSRPRSIWARTQPTALESLLRSQRNGMNNRERLRPRSCCRARPSSSLTGGVLGPAGLLFIRLLRSATRRARWRGWQGFPSMLEHVAGHDKSRVQLVALSAYPPPEPLTSLTRKRQDRWRAAQLCSNRADIKSSQPAFVGRARPGGVVQGLGRQRQRGRGENTGAPRQQMRILVDRFIYQGRCCLPSRHAACDQAIRGVAPRSG